MFCRNCGMNLNQGETFCSHCGAKVETQINNDQNDLNQNNMSQQMSNFNDINQEQGFFQSNNNFNMGTGQNFEQVNMMNQQIEPKKNNLIKIFAIVGGVIVGLVVLFVVIFFVISANSKKLVCTSEEGNITIMYNETEITGYTAVGITYDMDGQKEYAKQIGVDAYIAEFENWFVTNTSGSCVIED